VSKSRITIIPQIRDGHAILTVRNESKEVVKCFTSITELSGIVNIKPKLLLPYFLQWEGIGELREVEIYPKEHEDIFLFYVQDILGDIVKLSIYAGTNMHTGTIPVDSHVEFTIDVKAFTKNKNVGYQERFVLRRNFEGDWKYFSKNLTNPSKMFYN